MRLLDRGDLRPAAARPASRAPRSPARSRPWRAARTSRGRSGRPWRPCSRGTAPVERALDVADALELAEAADHVLHGGGHLRRIGLDRALALDRTRSPTVLGKPASSTIIEPRLESPLPDAAVSRFFWPMLPPTMVASDDEEDPSEDGGLAVRGTPSACAGREIAGLHFGGVPSGEDEEERGMAGASQPRRALPRRSPCVTRCGLTRASRVLRGTRGCGLPP